MMQETLLRVLVVAMGLLMCPRDDPKVEEWDDSITVGMQRYEERLLRREEKLDQETTPVSEEVTRGDNKGPHDYIKNIPEERTQSDQRVLGKETPDLDVTVANQDSDEDSADHRLPEGHFIDKSDLSLPQKYDSKPEMAHEKGEDVQTDGSFRDPGGPQDQHEQPEEGMFSSKEQEAPLSHVHTKTENETSEEAVSEWDTDYLWYISTTFSLISMIRFFRKCLRKNSQMKREVTRAFPVTCTVAEALLPDICTLKYFYSKCVQVSSEKKWRGDVFTEGFANDLLDAMRTICDKNGGMVIEDFQIVNFCDIIMPFTPPEPYGFQCLLWNNQASDLWSDMQVCGQIKLVENKKIQNGCHCQSSDADDDMVCLLHCDSERAKTKIADVCDGLLCLKSTPFLSKSQVTRWFQSAIKEAWAQISHKYDFELNIRYIDAPGAVVIRFRSGKRISFSINPVVKFNTDAHFFITPWSSHDMDTFWTLSLNTYEDSLLEHLSKQLPENSCHIQTLEIACFLHKRQTALSGSSALKDYHFKTALLHLLLTKDPSQWKPNNVACRLRDLLAFIERSLETKRLNHALIGNPLSEVIELPAEFTKAKPVNLFHPLVVHNCMYRSAVMHFQEMLRNTHMLIHDYVDQCTNSGSCSTEDTV